MNKILLICCIVLISSCSIQHKNCKEGNCINGRGTWKYSRTKYVGEFKDGKRNGRGTLTLSGGIQYVGEFKDHKYNGQGTMTWPSGQKHVGEWKDGKRNGRGTLTLSGGMKYVGEYKDGRFYGQGTYTWPSGKKYVGEWKDGKYNGQGTVTYPTGIKYVGEFKDNKYNGRGTFYYANGHEKQGIWENGKLTDKKIQKKSFPVRRKEKAAPKRSGNYYALVIGNNEYRYLPKLRTAKNDARAVAKTLRTKYGFETEILLDATRSKLLKGISGMRKKLEPDDNLIIYYAGHGHFDKVADKAYWMPVDSERDDDANWIIVDSITSKIKRISSNHILVVADSCYSGTLTRSLNVNLNSRSKRERYLKKMMKRSSRTLIASGGNEPVSDSGGRGHSIFAQAFIDGLNEMELKSFTAEEFFVEYIKEQVAGSADQVPEYNTIRNSGHKGGDFVFRRME